MVILPRDLPDNASGRVDCTCGDNVERKDGSGGDEGGIDGDEGADMAKGEDGADSELDKFTSRSVDPQPIGITIIIHSNWT